MYIFYILYVCCILCNANAIHTFLTYASPPKVTTFWLVDPDLTSAVGRLEHLGYIRSFAQRLAIDAQAASAHAAAHASYGL